MQNYGFRHEVLCKFLSFCPFLTMKKVLICPFSNYFLLSFLCTDPCTYTGGCVERLPRSGGVILSLLFEVDLCSSRLFELKLDLEKCNALKYRHTTNFPYFRGRRKYELCAQRKEPASSSAAVASSSLYP